MLPEIDRIVELAAQRKASDVHIVCGLPVKCRIDGNIVDLLEDTISSEQSESFARFLLGDRFEKIANIGEIDIGYTFPADDYWQHYPQLQSRTAYRNLDIAGNGFCHNGFWYVSG